MKKQVKVEQVRNGIWLDTDITYAQTDAWFGHVTRNLKLDIMRPFSKRSRNENKPYPCIVWVCGGGWLQMDIHAHLPNFIELVRSGYVIASVEYRDSNQAKFPAQLQDIKSAIRYLRANAKRYGIDPDHIGIMGESAGGHLAAMTAVTGEHKEYDQGPYLEFTSEVQAACSWYLPCDFTKMPVRDEITVAMSPESWLIGDSALRNPELVRMASPATYIDEHTPPFLLIHGTKDTVVPFHQSEIMYEALESRQIPVDLIAIEGADHADIHFFQPEVMGWIQVFFDQYLKG